MHNTTIKSILRAKLFIERNLPEELNGENIAAAASLSYFHFQHQFKAITGETLWQFVKRVRLEKAHFLLYFTSLPITDIAYQIGFESVAALSKAFKKWYGYSPQNCRNQILNSSCSSNKKFNWNEIKTSLQPEQTIISFRNEGTTNFPKGYFNWLELINNSIQQKIPLIGRSPDQPGFTKAEQLRWDTGIPKEFIPAGLLTQLKQENLYFEDTLPKGKYLVVPFTGFGSALTIALPEVLSRLRLQGIEWRDSGLFHQALRQHEPNNSCVTELFIPIV